MDVTAPVNPSKPATTTQAKPTQNGPRKETTVSLIENDLALWFPMKAGSFQPFDARTPGNRELAERPRGT